MEGHSPPPSSLLSSSLGIAGERMGGEQGKEKTWCLELQGGEEHPGHSLHGGDPKWNSRGP